MSSPSQRGRASVPFSRRRAINDCRLRGAVRAVVEQLEVRQLLSDSMPGYVQIWQNLRPGARRDLAILEYEHPAFAAELDTELTDLGLTPVASQAPTPAELARIDRITADDEAVSARLQAAARRAKRHHRPARHSARALAPTDDSDTPPTVTSVNYEYETLPHQLVFNFSQDVSATDWTSAVTVINLNTETTVTPVSATYSSATDSVTYSFSSTAPLANGNYAAVLHGSAITNTDSLDLVGSDSVAGDDYVYDFFFYDPDFNLDRTVDFADLSVLLQNYDQPGPLDFSQGDANYDGSVNVEDLSLLLVAYGHSLPLLGSPGTPTETAANPDAVELSWPAASDPNVTGYDVYRDSQLIASDVSATTFVDTGLTSDTAYSYLIVSRDADGDSSYPSAELIAQTANAGTIAPPTDLTVAAVTPGSISLAWTASPGVTEYQIDNSEDGVNFSTLATGVSGTAYTDTAVLPGYSYTYVVQADDDGVLSPDSNSAEGTIVPLAPTNVFGTIASDGSVALSWDAPVGATGYTILRQEAGEDSFSAIGTSTTPTFTDTSVLDGQTSQYEVVASDSGGSSPPSTAITPYWDDGTTAAVVGRWIFYNDSVFDGNDPSINADDDNAIATDKQALLPGQGSTFANVTSCTQGIDGIMVDIANLPGTVTASDFSFLVGTGGDPSTWTAAPSPSDVEVRDGAGVDGSDRVEVAWPSGTDRNVWLQVTVDANSDTGLSVPDVFYFGNLIGSDIGTVADDQYIVTANDLATTRNDLHSFLDPATITNPGDLNRDGKVDATDMEINGFAEGDELPRILGTPGAPYCSTTAVFAGDVVWSMVLLA